MHKNNYMELTKIHMAEQARGTHAAELPKLCMDAKGMLKILQQVGPAEKSISSCSWIFNKYHLTEFVAISYRSRMKFTKTMQRP